MKKILYIAACITATVVLAFSCRKDEQGTSHLSVRMKDAPGDFQMVNVDVQRVEVHTSAEGWVTLDTEPGVYDLLKLRDSAQAILVSNDNLFSGQLDEIRLVLGSHNSVVVDSIEYPLATPSAQQSGLKIKMDTYLAPDTEYVILLDFDAALSIVTQGNGSYSLKPVIHVESIFIP